MKIIALGDTHGRHYWNHIADNETFDKLIFMGDYFDSKEDITAEIQAVNFLNIIDYKKQNRDKVVLLFGNHDYHYLKTATEKYSGYEFDYAGVFGELLNVAIDQGLLHMCFATEKHIFTHAGITKTWAKANFISLDNMEDNLNILFRDNPNAFKFKQAENFDPTGDNIYQSPIWVRPNSLLKDGIDGLIQIVGHTPQTELILSNDILFIDALGEKQQYLKIINGEYSVGSIQIFTIKQAEN